MNSINLDVGCFYAPYVPLMSSGAMLQSSDLFTIEEHYGLLARVIVPWNWFNTWHPGDLQLTQEAIATIESWNADWRMDLEPTGWYLWVEFETDEDMVTFRLKQGDHAENNKL